MAFEIGHFCTFQTSVTMILTLDQITRHTGMYHSSTSTCITSEKLFTDGRRDTWMYGLVDSGHWDQSYCVDSWKSRPNNDKKWSTSTDSFSRKNGCALYLSSTEVEYPRDYIDQTYHCSQGNKFKNITQTFEETGTMKYQSQRTQHDSAL